MDSIGRHLPNCTQIAGTSAWSYALYAISSISFSLIKGGLTLSNKTESGRGGKLLLLKVYIRHPQEEMEGGKRVEKVRGGERERRRERKKHWERFSMRKEKMSVFLKFFLSSFLIFLLN